MTTTLVDSNVLLDLLTEDRRWFGWSSRALAEAADRGRIVINAVVYSEISVRFSRIEELEEAIPRTLVEREHIPYEAAFLAGKVFLAYRRAGGRRHSPLPDFLIGAHAAVAGYRFLTRDRRRRYHNYFPKLDVIAPE